ncbi:50S ribosomal protein L23 [Flavobacteriales bacterium]|jgi:large subunit ribosomal protein L23|nr:50S ribosomal protein L23 [Flavobacteriales bacterium]
MGIIKKPIITEKMTSTEEQLGQYGFIVDEKANKIEIKKAVEEMYGVTVTSVNTMRYLGKKKRNKKTYLFDGRTNSFKKAVISISEGDTIDIYSNL